MVNETMFDEHAVSDAPAHDDIHSVVEQVITSIKGEDEELEKKHPFAPFALVFGFYPIVLLVVALLVGVYSFVGRDSKNIDEANPNSRIEVQQSN